MKELIKKILMGAWSIIVLWLFLIAACIVLIGPAFLINYYSNWFYISYIPHALIICYIYGSVM